MRNYFFLRIIGYPAFLFFHFLPLEARIVLKEISLAMPGNTVLVHYTGKLEDGSEFDSTRNLSPLEFKLGSQSVISGFESAIQGMSSGDRKTVEIPCEQAYGEHRKDLVTTLNLKFIPSEIKVSPGIQLQTEGPFGYPVYMMVTHITDKTVTLDANHHLAGKKLIFDIEVLRVY